MAKFVIVQGSKILYHTFKRAQKVGGKALSLNPKDPTAPRRIALFDIDLKDEMEPRIPYRLEVSYVPKSVHNEQPFITYDLKRYENGNVKNISRPEVLGLGYPGDFLLAFLRMHNAKTGTLAQLQKNKAKVPADNATASTVLEASSIDFYSNILRGETFKVNHKGNDATGKWKYELTEAELAEVIEAFAMMFRDSTTANQLNLNYGEDFRAQYALEIKADDSGSDSAATGTDDGVPSF